jgi:hypothetical protein
MDCHRLGAVFVEQIDVDVHSNASVFTKMRAYRVGDAEQNPPTRSHRRSQAGGDASLRKRLDRSRCRFCGDDVDWEFELTRLFAKPDQPTTGRVPFPPLSPQRKTLRRGKFQPRRG